jgi:uncharacterized membrane protein
VARQYRRHCERTRTEITEQIPDKSIAWHTRSVTENAGVVTFHYLNELSSRIMLQMEYQPEGLFEKAGDLLGVASRRVAGDLRRFKEFVGTSWDRKWRVAR